MKTLASYASPESYADERDIVGVATAGVHVGKLWSSLVIIEHGPRFCVPTAYWRSEGNTDRMAYCFFVQTPGVQPDLG